MKTLFTNARIIRPEKIFSGWLAVENGVIRSFGEGSAELAPAAFAGGERIDCGGNYLSPGFIDIHAHGAGGADFMDGSVSAFETAALMHLAHGATTILPTAMSSTTEEMETMIETFRKALPALKGRGPELYGLHLEGPYLSPAQAGAMIPEYIRAPQPEEYEHLLEAGKGIIKRWTFAVDYPESMRFARRLTEEGILPSVGHCDAEYSEVLSAFQQGVTHATHLFSCMSTIKRIGGFRHSGLLESCFCIDNMTVELIADGCHVPPELLALTYKIKGPEKIALVSDSMRCAGLDVKEARIGSLENGQTAIIEDGVAKLPDRSAFAGSVALDDRLVRVMHQKAGVPLHDAVRMMTLTPAEIIGLGGRKGSIEAGKDADLILFDENINVKLAMVGGKTLWQAERG